MPKPELEMENLDSISLESKANPLVQISKPTILIPQPVILFSPKPLKELDAAAIKLQKVYKSYRTRRNLADCAVVVEELWWKALDFAALKQSSVSFFNVDRTESVISRWGRAKTRAAKVGKGLSKDEKARKLALQHWLEAIDPRHRYGRNLHFYYDVWCDTKSAQPFFYWLDVGDAKETNLEQCPRTVLQRQCIKYLGPKERESFEVIVKGGKLIYRASGMPLNTDEVSKWIFVLSTSRALYVGQKKKGLFQHSSFLSGAATTAAGRMVCHDGNLEAIWPYSGHYLPTEDNFKEFIGFLEEHHVDLTNVKRYAIDDDSSSFKVETNLEMGDTLPEVTTSFTDAADISNGLREEISITTADKRDDMALTDTALMECPGFDMGETLSGKWSSGVGPRIGCVRDYPSELQFQALEKVNLSPGPITGHHRSSVPIPSPRPSPNIRLSPRLAYMGLPSPSLSVSTPC